MTSYNSEDYTQNWQSTKENEEEYFGNGNSDESMEMIADSADVPLRKMLLLVLIVIIYVGLMMTTGVIVYSTYGSDQAGTSLDRLTSINIAVNSGPVTGMCPVNDICPSTRSFCWEQVPSSSHPTACPIRPSTTERPIQVFRTVFYENHRVLDLLNLYPPNSPKRLEVVTTLLYKTVEQFAMLGHFHRCGDSLTDRPLFETVCSFCNDRYEYVRCVMSNQLVDQLYPDEPSTANHLVPIFWETEVFDRIVKMIRPFSVKTASGDECRVCKDFNETVYDRCYTKDTWYTFPAHRPISPSLVGS